MAPLNPFLQSIARQRGIPVLVIGIIFTFLPIFNVIVRPVTGYLTDRWRCHKLVLLCASLSNAFFTPLIHFTPDFKDDGHAEDLSIMTNWKFWIFVVAVTVRMMLWMVGDVLQDTICLQILGDDKKNYGRNRVWGAIGWGLSTFLVGACVDWYSQDQSEKNYLPAYLIAMVFLICHFTIASRLECNQISTSKSMPTSIVSIVSNTKVFSYLVWAVFAGIFTAYIWYYLFLYIDDLANNYHHERIPYIKTIQGLSVTIECCISEIPTYFLSANSPINPFLSTLAKHRGYSPIIVGDIFTFLLLLNVVVKPLTGYVTDKWKCRRTVFLSSILLNALLTPTLYLIPGATSLTGEMADTETLSSWTFWLFTAVVTLRMVLFMIGEVLQETICMGILGGDTLKFGEQRLWGSTGWGVMSVVAGSCIDWYSLGREHKDHLPGYLLSTASFLVDFAVARKIKVLESESPTGNILKDVKNVINNAKVCVFLVWAVAGGVFTAYVWFYFLWYIDDLTTIYHPERKPLLNSIQGVSLTIECLGGEVPFFYLSGYLIKLTGHMTAFSLSFALFSLRFLLYSVIRDPLWVLPVELLNGVTFGLSYIAGITYAAKIAPVGSEGTIQGLFSMAFQGFGASLGATIAGYTFSHMGSVMAFRLIGYVAMIVTIVQIIVNHFMKTKTKSIDP